MKLPGLRKNLLPIALCALIFILLIKLAITVGGSLYSRDNGPSIGKEAIAVQERPREKSLAEAGNMLPSLVSESHAAPVPAEKASEKQQKKTRDANSTGESLSVIQQKENDLRKKEELLNEKEERLARIEKEVEQKTKELLIIQKEIQSFRNEKQDSQNNKVRSLAKIYGTMKAKEAAKLMENLDDKLVMGIISIMTPDEAAAILSLMEIKKAAKISEALSGR